MSLQDPKAIVHFAGNDLFIGITPSKHAVTLDADHTRAAAPTPMELLLVALGSCTAVDVIGILRKKREDVKEYRVEVQGQRRDEHPRSFSRMEVHH
ncbi:MAG: OsmC family protein, partial [Pyrinomonadaceae bacterium]|nr:OsmC family protein [Pyrinomonadaceae bacterium]